MSELINLHTYRNLGILIVLSGIVSFAQARVEIDTLVGNGADSDNASDDSLFGAAVAYDTPGTLRPHSMNTRFRSAPVRRT